MLGNNRFDFTRTRWTVKPGDLYQLLIVENIIGIPKPAAFSLPALGAEANRIAVMMPFSAEFTAVWQALRAAADDGGWICQRADDIWDDSLAVGYDLTVGRAIVYVTANSGRTWRSLTAPPRTFQLNAVACTGPRRCEVGGIRIRSGTPLLAGTSDGGRGWHIQPVSQG